MNTRIQGATREYAAALDRLAKVRLDVAKGFPALSAIAVSATTPLAGRKGGSDLGDPSGRPDDGEAIVQSERANGRQAKPRKPGRKVRGVFWRDGQWWIRWTCTLGHDHRQPSGDLKTAATEEHQAKRAEVREARKAGREWCPRLVVKERPLLVEEILADYMEHSRRTKRSTDDDNPKEKRFKTLFGGRLATDISSKEVEDFKSSFLEEEVTSKIEGESRRRTRATVNHYLKFLKAVFNRAVKHGRITYNPVRAVNLYRENNARNRCLTAEEEIRLMEGLPMRLRLFVTVALHTGMRRGELQGLRWEDVDFSTAAIHVRQDKAGDGRWVTMNSAAREALLAVKREQKILSPHVFSSPTGRFLWNWEREWRPALEAAAIPDFRFHDCRHTFASRLTMAGVDLYTVQRAGGWKTQTMVQRYAHLSPDHIKAAVERLAQWNSGRATGTKTGTGT